MRITVTDEFVKLLIHQHASKLSQLMHVSYGWHCVSDQMCVGNYSFKKCDNMKLVNRDGMLQCESSKCVALSNNNVLKNKQTGFRNSTVHGIFKAYAVIEKH